MWNYICFVNDLTGDINKFVRDEKGLVVLLAEVDADGNDLPGGEGDSTRRNRRI